jgi:hypothetical protein
MITELAPEVQKRLDTIQSGEFIVIDYPADRNKIE